jgi:hypothetical protein
MNKTVHKIYIGSFFLIGILVTVLLIYNGFTYYSTSIEERFFNPDHSSLKPSGVWGHGFGIIGTLMMITGVAIYMLRKRNRKFFTYGYLKHWLELHIFLCSLGPILVLFHTAFKFGGIVSVSFWSMVIVVFSGVIGRFIYVQIPRTIQGKEIDISELSTIRQQISNDIYIDLSLNSYLRNEFDSLSSVHRFDGLSISKSLMGIITDYLKMILYLHNLNKQLKITGISKFRTKEIKKTVKAEIILSRRIGLLKTMRRLFHYWHIAHLPFAISMFVIMLIHVAVTIIFGYKWIF